MTKWQEFPLRPQGQPWPGLNTRGGRLDPGSGQLEDGSFNAIINEADVLEKRKGFVRGLDERFDGVVCGLFSYTDDCGVEYLVVADQEGIKVRQPFSIPVFLGSDAFPIDNFEGELKTDRWNNTEDYETSIGALVLTALAQSSTDPFVRAGRLMEWFKPSVLSSYRVEIQYDLNPNSLLGGPSEIGQMAAVVIKRNGTTYLQADVRLRADQNVYTVRVDNVQAGTRSTLIQQDLEGQALATGFLRLAYSQPTRTVTVRVTPSGGPIVEQSAEINELSDLNLGQRSAIGLAYQSGNTTPIGLEILSVTGGAL